MVLRSTRQKYRLGKKKLKMWISKTMVTPCCGVLAGRSQGRRRARQSWRSTQRRRKSGAKKGRTKNWEKCTWKQWFRNSEIGFKSKLFSVYFLETSWKKWKAFHLVNLVYYLLVARHLQFSKARIDWCRLPREILVGNLENMGSCPWKEI